MIEIITTQLKTVLPTQHRLQNHVSINPLKFDQILTFLQRHKGKHLCIYDKTQSKKLNIGEIVSVNDHLNNTGTNVLIGKQAQLKIDFIDMTNIYKTELDGIVAQCCGKNLISNSIYPCHYLCHITILAKALKFQYIKAYLINY
tara:strand:- start:51 stop:482 length:432 start_codon:yes stop_codon:yes gene_type:complete